jgi:hypothetical protein
VSLATFALFDGGLGGANNANVNFANLAFTVAPVFHHFIQFP